jgi:hypothetical protein
MPIRYAIRTERTTPLTRREATELKAQGYSAYEGRYSYEDVPPIVAETDETNGVYALFSSNGTKLSDWLLLKKPEVVEKELVLGRKKPGAALKDSIGQDIKQGDYIYTHSTDHQKLELSQILRNLKTKMIVEQISDSYCWSNSSGIRNRNPHSFIKIPSEVMEGGEVIPEQWEKRYVIHEIHERNGSAHRSVFTPVDEATAMREETGHFGYFNSKGILVTGWVDVTPSKYDQETLEKKVHGGRKVMDEPPVPVTDAMGTDIQLGDVVFSNDNHTNDFMLCEVIGFTKERVRLVAYDCVRGRNIFGYRLVTLNWPKNVVKLPMTITTI